MKTFHRLLIALALACGFSFGADQGGEVDFNRAREIFQRKQQGETLSTDDQAYLQKAMEARHRQQQGQNPAGDIDFNRVREIFQRKQKGETISAEDQAYLRKAMEARQRQMQAQGGDDGVDWQRAGELHRRTQSGEKLSPEDQAYYEKAKAARGRMGQAKGKGGQQGAPTGPAPGGKDSVGLTPLTELGAEKYKGEDGGLYGGGRNEPPPEHSAAAKKELAKIRPLDADGKPAADGKVVLLSVGMSNTTQEFSRFKQLADADPDKSPKLVIMDGAQGGQAAAQWITAPNNRVWQVVDQRMKTASVSDKQVQVVWIKQANIRPTETFPAHAKKLQADITALLNMLKSKFPNLRVAYLSSRIYAGYATTELNPEPFSYESGFTVRWLIQDQIKGDAKLNYDPARGEVKSPLLLWGPYLWGDGMKARKDGLTWTRDDLVSHDGTHPSTAGRQKVADLLLKFFKTDPGARTWFVTKP